MFHVLVSWKSESIVIEKSRNLLSDFPYLMKPGETAMLNVTYSRFNVNFNSVQRALVLEDYVPALRVRGFVSRKKGTRSMGEEKKEGETNNNIK